MKEKMIATKQRDAIIQSLKSGVTPRIGIQHIQVGRSHEIKALLKDIERVSEGGSAFRLVIGDYGSGKTFFLSVIRAIALEKKLVTVNADLSPDRRLHGSGGQARNLYSELMRNMATRSKPDGNALTGVVEKFITQSRKRAEESGNTVEEVIKSNLTELTELVGGYDFAKVIEAYWNGYEQSDEQLRSNALRWLRAEYSTKTDAKKDLGVRTIISDMSFYDSLKLMSLFVSQAGYAGLLVNLDEMVNLFKLSNTKARVSNYEQILRILNDCLQGTAERLGFLFGGTPEFLSNERKGLFSYEALKSRLAENNFSKRTGLVDYSSPSIHLANLTPEELYILLKNLRHVFASGNESDYLVPDEALELFLQHCSLTIGDAYFRTPRNTIKAFLDMLSLLEQNPSLEWRSLIGDVQVEIDRPSDFKDLQKSEGNDELTDFSL